MFYFNISSHEFHFIDEELQAERDLVVYPGAPGPWPGSTQGTLLRTWRSAWGKSPRYCLNWDKGVRQKVLQDKKQRLETIGISAWLEPAVTEVISDRLESTSGIITQRIGMTPS